MFKTEIRVKGGLGNQLFGLAAGWVISSRLKSDLVLNGSQLGWLGSNKSRKLEIDQFEWESFPNGMKFIKSRKALQIGRVGNRVSTHLTQRFLDISTDSLKDDNFDELESLENHVKKGSILDGEFIDFRWLDLAQAYGFPTTFTLLRGQKKFEPNYDQIAVHLRLGDFLHYPSIFPIPSEHFYEKALSEMNYGEIHIYSDDLSAAKKRYPALFSEASRVSGPDDFSGPETFILLNSYSKIITNSSTFSSVAAWGIHRKGGKVVCPEKYLLNTSKDTRPAEWIRISE